MAALFRAKCCCPGVASAGIQSRPLLKVGSICKVAASSWWLALGAIWNSRPPSAVVELQPGGVAVKGADGFCRLGQGRSFRTNRELEHGFPSLRLCQEERLVIAGQCPQYVVSFHLQAEHVACHEIVLGIQHIFQKNRNAIIPHGYVFFAGRNGALCKCPYGVGRQIY